MITEVITPVETDNLWFADSLERRPTKRRNLNIPEFAEKTIIPTGKYRGVMFRNDRAPYLVRPMQCLSPESNIQTTVCMFPAQSGKSTIGEIAASYYMKEVPSEILYVTSDERQARKWLDKRITPRANKLGIQFRAQTENKASRRSGDTLFSKEFDGGNLDAASSRSPAQLASETKRLVIGDETDRWKKELGAEGFTWDIIYARTQAWGDQKKILIISTPTTFEDSLIYPFFLDGTREEYFIPCPICGKFQTLDLYDNIGGEAGLKWETEAGRIKDDYVYYLCGHCHEAFFESKKYQFLNAGKWESQAKPLRDSIASFTINAIYSPFKDWIEIAQEWERAKEDPIRKHTFDNLVMGNTYRETGSRPKIEKAIEFRGSYKSGQVPNEVLWITAGADVQRGKKIYEQYTDSEFERECVRLTEEGRDLWKCDLPRIELEVLGHSHGYRTYSIEYKIFFGSTLDPDAGAWEKLRQWMEETGLIYSRLDGSKIACNLVFVDSGDGERMTQVYNFCEQYPGIFPIKGDQVLKKKKDEKGDELMASAYKRYTVSKIGEGQFLYTIATNYYKNQVYVSLRKNRIAAEEQVPRFPEFPKDYPDYYFQMLTAEEKHADGSFHAGGRRNESLDARVYALCAGDVWLDNQVNHYREILIKKGMPRDQAKKVYTWKTQIEKMKFQRWAEMGKNIEKK